MNRHEAADIASFVHNAQVSDEQDAELKQDRDDPDEQRHDQRELDQGLTTAIRTDERVATADRQHGVRTLN